MSALEQRVKEAFDAITMPESLRKGTLEMIAAKAREQGEGDSAATPIAPPLDSARQGAAPKTVRCGVSAAAGAGAVTDAGAATSATAVPAAKKPRKAGGRKIIFAAAACLLLLALGFGGFSLYSTETAVVSLELNPSLELGLNRFDTVIDARALNSDGEAVLNDVAVVGKSYDEALALITRSDTFLSYVTKDSFVEVYVICGDDRQSASLVDRGWDDIANLPCGGACNRVSSERYHEAAGCGMGVARYEAAQVLLSLDATLTIEDCATLSMRELQERIAELDPDNEYARRSGNRGSASRHPHRTAGKDRGQSHSNRLSGSSSRRP